MLQPQNDLVGGCQHYLIKKTTTVDKKNQAREVVPWAGGGHSPVTGTNQDLGGVFPPLERLSDALRAAQLIGDWR